jgi:hypothetical protein
VWYDAKSLKHLDNTPTTDAAAPQAEGRRDDATPSSAARAAAAVEAAALATKVYVCSFLLFTLSLSSILMVGRYKLKSADPSFKAPG